MDEGNRTRKTTVPGSGAPDRMHGASGRIASVPIGFLVSGFLHLVVVTAIVLSLSGPAPDALPGEDAPMTMTLAMFESSQPEEPTPGPMPPELEPPVPEPPPPEPAPEKSEAVEPLPPPPPEPKPRPRSAPQKNPKPPETMASKAVGIPMQAKPAPSATAAREEQRYLAALRARIERRKYYPRASRRRGETGKVIVRFVIRKDGAFTDMKVVRSSGIPRLDEAALKTLRRVAPFKPIPASLGRERWALSVPIAYRLEHY